MPVFGDTPVVEGQASLSCSAPGGQYLLLGFLCLGYEAEVFSLLQHCSPLFPLPAEINLSPHLSAINRIYAHFIYHPFPFTHVSRKLNICFPLFNGSRILYAALETHYAEMDHPLYLIPAVRNALFCDSIQKRNMSPPPALSAAEPVYDPIGNFSPRSVPALSAFSF